MDKLRLRFQKTGKAVYISHLDLMRVVQRIFLRAGTPIKYSEGFNPHALISICLPLSVGMASECELMDFRVTREVDLAALPETLNAVSPEGVRFLAAYEPERKAALIKWLRVRCEFEYDSRDALALLPRLEAYFSSPEVKVTRRTKRGEGEFELAPHLRDMEWTARPGLLGWLGAGGILASVSNRSWWRRRTRCLVGGTAALCFAVSVMPVSQPITTWTQLSVGTADAAVLETGGEVWAIDAGEGDDLAVYLRQRRLSLTGLILTHLHSDHAGGVRYLLESGIPVERCYLPWGAELSAAVPSVAEAVEALMGRGAELHYLQAGDVLELPTGRMRVLWPQAEKVRRDADLNDFCLVTLWELGEARLLSMSDLPGTYEPYVATPADVLKVGHHGQADSTGSAFAQIVAPEVALVSAGRNLDLAKLADRLPGTALYWTGDCGAVTLQFSGKRVEVYTWLPGQKE